MATVGVLLLLSGFVSGCVSGAVAKGRRAMDDGAYETAARWFTEAAEATPQDPERWVELGRAEMAADRPTRARRAFERLAALRRGDPGPRILVGFTWELQRRYDEALVAYQQARELAPDDPRGHRVLGTRLLRWGEAGAAVEPLGKAVELGPEHAETWNAYALAQYHAGDMEGAERAFRGGLSLHPEHRGLYLGLAALLVNAGRHAQALAVYDQVVDRFSDFAAAHVGRALLLHELGRPDEAEAAFEDAVDVARDPRPYRARLERYRALRRGTPAPQP